MVIPLAFEIVLAVAGTLLFNTIRFPAVPLTLKLVTVNRVVQELIIVQGDTVLFKVVQLVNVVVVEKPK